MVGVRLFGNDRRRLLPYAFSAPTTYARRGVKRRVVILSGD
jgi:hypothetical protein